MKRSLIAVASGYLTVSLTTATTFTLLNTVAPGQLNMPSWLIIKLILAILGAALGGMITARLAPARPLAHTFVLAGLMFILSIAAVVVSFGSEPLWFQMGLLVTSAIATSAGGLLALRWGQVSTR